MSLFFRNPRLLATALVLVVVSGMSALATIVRQEDPTITNGVAVIVSPFPGASAERVEALVTEKIEAELRELAEIETISSISRNGVAVIAVEIDERIKGKDAEEAFSKVRDSLNDAYAKYPPGLPPPIFDDERFGSYTLIKAITWDMPGPPRRGLLKRYAEELQAVLRDVYGTDTVRVYGAPEEEITVTFDPQAMAAAGLGTGQVAEAIRAGDAKVSAGVLRGDRNDILIEVTGELDSLERIRRIPLSRGQSGSVLSLGDIADVRRQVQSPADDLAVADGKPAVIVAAQLATGQRYDVWAERAYAAVAAFEAELPDGLGLETVFDQTTYTEARLSTLGGNLLTGFAIVVAVLFITLGVRSALIVSLTLPLVSLAAIFVLRLLGVPIHQMSVTGLIVALGLLVDNAIVMTDAIRAKRLQGVPAAEAVRASLAHLWSPLLSSTATTIMAFMPILLLAGRAGEFVGAIGLSVIVSLAISYLFAMTIVPAIAGRYLKGADSASDPSFWTTGLRLPRLTRRFEQSLDWSLAHPKKSMLFASVLPLAGFFAATALPQQFFPPADRDQFHIEMRLPQQASIEETARATERVDAVLRQSDAIVGTTWFIGRSAPPFYYNLKQDQDGNRSYAQAQVQTTSVTAVEELMPKLQRKLDEAVPSAQILLRELLQGPPVDAPVELRIYGPQLSTLRELGLQLRERMSRVPTIIHSISTLTATSPKIWLEADENEASIAGLGLVDLAGQLNYRLEGVPGGSILEGNQEIPVKVRVSDETRSTLERIGSTPLLARNGGNSMVQPEGFPGIPLETLVDVELRPTLDGIPHRNGRRVNVVRGYTTSGVYPETAFNGLMKVLDEDPLVLPPGYRLEVGGDAAERSDAMANLFAYVPVLVLLMVAFVSLSLDSFRLGGVVFAVAIQSMGLGLLSIALFGYPLGFQGMIGLIGLVGVAINAAIVINSSLRTDQASVAGLPSAIRNVVLGETSRHIVSTTITTFGGFLPLILSPGGFWPPFATGIAGGVLLSTVISFYFVPAAFLLVTRRRPVSQWADERRKNINRAGGLAPEAAE
ncbi:MAG TPA: efflux RND transporter permease subunit [Polyangiales bacterium]|nr:efflux RND transporter permease subunit [Polyangiales bacterium]